MFKAGIESNTRLVISGDTLELFRYKQPYFYDWLDLSKKNRPHKGESSLIAKREDNIQRAKATVRRLVQCNQEDQVEIPKFITLTHANDIQTIKESNPYFRTYEKEVRRTYGNMQYIAVPEFQPVSGRVHYHVLYFNMPYINNHKESLDHVWPYGFTKIEAVRSINAMPRYISKYMTKNLGDKRLNGHKSYFTSRNLQRPIVVRNQKRANEIISQWAIDLKQVSERAIQDYRGRDITYSLFKGAKALTQNLRLLELF